jgi:hypothetical protein
MATGRELIEACKEHLIHTMLSIPDCRPTARGAGSRAIETAAALNLDLPENNGWLTWSLLASMAIEGRIEMLRTPGGRRRFRLR